MFQSVLKKKQNTVSEEKTQRTALPILGGGERQPETEFTMFFLEGAWTLSRT